MTQGEGHTPVLLKEIIHGLQLKEDHVVVDATINGGGHSEAIAQTLGDTGILVGIDADSDALLFARERLTNVRPRVCLKEGNNRNLDVFLKEEGLKNVDRFLFDLGMSSRQLAFGNRGFSFERDEPLVMTLAKKADEGTLTAYDIVNSWDEQNIADVIYGYGEERYARRIAKAIVLARKKKPIISTTELVAIIRSATPLSYGRIRIHPATKTFQALRIAVNDELTSLKEALDKALQALDHNGRILVISFHSLEDRIVKQTFKKWKEEGYGTIITKKPIRPTIEEIKENPRSRSAKLRIFEKV